MALSQTDMNALRTHTRVISAEMKSADILILKLSIPDACQFEAGQSLILWKNDTEGRNYFITHLKTDGY